MFDISPDKIVVVLVIALVVLGPGRLAEAARALGRARAQLRKLSSGLPPDTTKLIRDPRGAFLDGLTEPGRAIADAADLTRRATTPTTEQDYEEGKR